jgi:hypothetical protein
MEVQVALGFGASRLRAATPPDPVIIDLTFN